MSAPKKMKRGGAETRRKAKRTCSYMETVPLLRRGSVIAELRDGIAMFRRSYSEVDGVVRDRGALRTMAALFQAIEAVKLLPSASPRLCVSKPRRKS